MSKQELKVKNNQVCYTMSTPKNFKTFDFKTHPHGNEGVQQENWYRRACVVILPNNSDDGESKEKLPRFE